MRNEHGVSKVTFVKKVRAYCPLGRQEYEANIECIVKCGDTIPDYLELDAAIDGINGDMLTVEALARSVHDMTMKAFGGAQVDTVVSVGQSKHFPVTVEVSN